MHTGHLKRQYANCVNCGKMRQGARGRLKQLLLISSVRVCNFLSINHSLLQLVLLADSRLLTAWSLCPAPFNVESGKCVFVNTSQSFTWCQANQLCASMGGELINSHSSLQLLSSMPSTSCSCKFWVGVTDLADERISSRSGWQRVNGNGVLPLDDSLWLEGMPNNNFGNQDCISISASAIQFIDFGCSATRGFACEFVEAAPPWPVASGEWRRTEFKRSSFNPSSDYCYTDLPQVKSAMHCVAAALRAGHSRQALYNSKLRACRLLLFSDAQVEEDIETSADWVKFSFY